MIRTLLVLALCRLAGRAAAHAQAPAASGAAGAGGRHDAAKASAQAAPDRAWISVSAESRAPSPREAQRRNVGADAAGPGGAARPRACPTTPSAPSATTCSRSSTSSTASAWRAATWRATPSRSASTTSTRVGELLETVGQAGRDVGERPAVRPEGSGASSSARRCGWRSPNARLKAEAAAAGAGRTLDRLVRIEEAGASAPPVPMPQFRAPWRPQAAEARPAAGRDRPDRGPRASDGDLQLEIGSLRAALP